MSRTNETNDAPDRKPSMDSNNLSDADTLVFINSLIDQNSELSSELKRVGPIAKLAEERLHEATARLETANAEARRIVAEAKQAAEKKALEILKAAGENAQAVKRSTEEEARGIISIAKQKADAAEWQAREIRNAAEAKAKGARIFAEEEATRIISEAREKAQKEAHLARLETEQLLARNKMIAESRLKEVSKLVSKEPLSPSKNIEEKPTVTTQVRENSDAGESLALYQGNVELVLAPPVAAGQLVKLGRQLKHFNYIKVVGLDGSLKQGIRMRLFLQKRIPLLKVLKAMPEVETASGGLGKTQESPMPVATEPGVRSVLVKVRR